MVIAGNQLDKRGLAGAVVAQEPHDLVIADLEVYVVKRGDPAEGL